MQIVLIFSFLLSTFLLHQSTQRLSHSFSDYCVKLFIAFVACVIPTGYLLSELQLINQTSAWAITIFFAGIFWFIARNKPINYQFKLPKLETISAKFQHLPISEKLIFGLLGSTLFIVSLINFIIVFVSVPNEWDSMTGHLVKCAYYLQNGNMNRLNGTTWTIDYYPNSLPTIQIYFYQLFQSEKGFKVIHYLSYWIFAIAMYGICRNLGQTRKASIFIFLLTTLLPSTLVQATTTETDLVFTAYLACVVYLMLNFKRLIFNEIKIELNKNSNIQHFVFLALSAAIWISHKSTFILVSPALGIVVLFCLWRLPIRKLLVLAGLFLFFCTIYVLPNGYLANMKAEGRFSPSAISAPKSVMAYHSIEPFTKREILKYGTKNVFRYAFDFFSLDGIRNTETGKELNDLMRKIPIQLAQKLNLEEPVFWVVNPFYFEPKFPYHKERPYWGVISFLLILPMMILVGVKALRHRGKKESRQKGIGGQSSPSSVASHHQSEIRNPKSKIRNISYFIFHNSYLILLFACIVHFICLSFTAHYDPIKGRYFLNMAVWALPFAGLWFGQAHTEKRNFYLLFCAFFIISSAFCTVLLRANYPIFSEKGKKNIFEMNRMEQLTLLRPDFYPAYQKADSLIPQKTNLAVALISEDYEYPLWGENLSRKLIPIKPFNQNLKAIPSEADYLFYAKGVLPYNVGDIQLNEGNITPNDTPMPENIFYLRRLK